MELRSSQQYWPMAQTEVGLVAVPLFHKNAMRGTVKPALYAGAKFVIMPRFDTRSFLEALAKYRVTFTGGVPAIFSMLLKERDLIAGLDYPALKMFSLGSAVVAPEMIDTLERVFPGVKVKESYGLTEAGGPLRSPSDKPSPRGSCGIIARLRGQAGRLCRHRRRQRGRVVDPQPLRHRRLSQSSFGH